MDYDADTPETSPIAAVMGLRSTVAKPKGSPCSKYRTKE